MLAPRINTVCEIAPAISRVTGLAANSASPTDTWLVRFRDGFEYDKSPLRNGFLKIFINPNSLSPLDITDNQRALLYGLDYEVFVYLNITNALLRYHVAPTYVKAIAGGSDCTYRDLFNMLNGHLYAKDSSRQLPPDDVVRMLNRNLYFIWKKQPRRKAIDDVSSERYYNPKFEEFRYNMILSESSGDSPKLEEWYRNTTSAVDFWRVMFLACIGCYGMFLSRMTHNDIHTGNLFVTDLGEVRQYVFRIENATPFVVSTRYVPKIYDYDRAFVRRAGNNPLNDFYFDNFCLIGSQCNLFVPNKDMIKVFCYVYNHIPSVKEEVLDILTSNPRSREILRTSYEEARGSCFLQSADRMGALRALPVEEYARFNSPYRILVNLYNKLKVVDRTFGKVRYDAARWGKNNVYALNSLCFTDMGEIIVENQTALLNVVWNDVTVSKSTVDVDMDGKGKTKPKRSRRIKKASKSRTKKQSRRKSKSKKKSRRRSR